MKLLDIEKLATSAVTSSLSKTEHLSSYLAEGDKEPSWDGNIYIHEDSKHSKKNLKKIPAQIKGKLADGEINETIKYPVDILDLKAYQQNGGSFYFVVYIDKNTGNTLQIYYASLLPFKITQMLKGKENTTSLSISFKKFPNDNDEKTELLLNFYDDAVKQISFAGKDLPTIEELEEKGILESLTIQYTGLASDDVISSFPRVVEGKDLFVYANVKDMPIPIPVELHENVSKFTINKKVNTSVYVGETKYFEFYYVTTTAEEITIQIGNCLWMVFSNKVGANNTYKAKTKIAIKGTLNQRLNGIPFIDALIKSKSFRIGQITIPVDFEIEKLKNIHYDEFDKTLESLQRYKRVFDKLHIKKDLDIEKCTNGDFNRLNALVAAIEDNATIYGFQFQSDFPTIINFHVANLCVMLLCEKTNDNGCKLFDYFGKTIDIVALDAEENHQHTSQYSILKKENFENADNMNYTSIVDGFKSVYPMNYHNTDLANLVMLEMIKAYDEEPNTELLSSIEELCNWLLTQTDYIDSDIEIINQLQIIIRKRELTFNEKQKLVQIVNSSKEPLHRAGAFILLGERAEAENILSSIDENTLRYFKEYPIYHIYDKMCSENQ